MNTQQQQYDAENEQLDRLLQEATPAFGRSESFIGQFKNFASEDYQNCEIDDPRAQLLTTNTNTITIGNVNHNQFDSTNQSSSLTVGGGDQSSRDEESYSPNDEQQSSSSAIIKKKNKEPVKSNKKVTNTNTSSILTKRKNQDRKTAAAASSDALEDSSDEEGNEAEMVMFEGKRITKKMLYYIQNPIVDKNKVYDIRVDKAEYKKARKRIQNRESAVRSRQRKLEVKQELEEKSNILLQENNSLKKRVEELEQQLRAKEQAAEQAIKKAQEAESKASLAAAAHQQQQQQTMSFRTLDSMGGCTSTSTNSNQASQRARLESQQSSLSNATNGNNNYFINSSETASQLGGATDQSQEIDIDNFFQFPNKRKKTSNNGNENSHPFMDDFYDNPLFSEGPQLTDDEDQIILRQSHSKNNLGNFFFSFGLICMFNYMGSTMSPSAQDGSASNAGQNNDNLGRNLLFGEDDLQYEGSTLAEQELNFRVDQNQIGSGSGNNSSGSGTTLISVLRSLWDSNPEVLLYAMTAVLILVLIVFLVGPLVKSLIFGSDLNEKKQKKHNKKSRNKSLTKDVTV